MSIAMKYRAKKMARGGDMYMDEPMSEPTPAPKADEMTKSMKKAFNFADGGAMPCKACGYHEGGFVEEEMASGYGDNPEVRPDYMFKHPVENQSHDGDDMIDGIMMSRAKGYSEGGQVANDTESVNVDDMDSQYDELVKDDDLESSYDAKNSGDEDGNEELDKEDDDMVSDVMKSRKKKDKNPSPA